MRPGIALQRQECPHMGTKRITRKRSRLLPKFVTCSIQPVRPARVPAGLSAPLRSADDWHLAMACSLLKVRDFGRILGRGPWLSAI